MGDVGSFRSLSATFFFASVVAGGAWAAVAAPGCALSNCDPAFETLTLADFPESDMLDDSTWESTRIASSWHPFDPQHTYGITTPLPFDRPADILVFLSADQDAIKDDHDASIGKNYAIGAGNIAETINFGNGGGFQIHNDSCAQYYFRLVVHSYGVVPPAADSGLDAGIEDASDAPSDTLDGGTTDAPLDVAEGGPIDASAHD